MLTPRLRRFAVNCVNRGGTWQPVIRKPSEGHTLDLTKGHFLHWQIRLNKLLKHARDLRQRHPLTQNYYENPRELFFVIIGGIAPSQSPGKKDFFQNFQVRFVISQIFLFQNDFS